MPTTIAIDPTLVTLVTTLVVAPENQAQLIDLLRRNTDTVVSGLNGWISTSFLVSTDRRHVVIYSQWQTHPDMRAYFPQIAALATFESIPGDVVYTRHA